MSDEEFLKRWSRRKQEAKAAEIPPVAAQELPQPAVTTEPEIDLSKLPPIDSITAATDISEFLRKGIPAELSRAALRRAWAADPAIRDFVGLAENAWDFTDPNAMPGFGALKGTPEQISVMVDRVIGGVRDAAEKLVDSPGNEPVPAKPDEEPRIEAADAALESELVAALLPGATVEPLAAVQPQASNKEHDDDTVRRHTHGGALPS